MQLLSAISFKILCKRLLFRLSAAGCTASGADETTFLIDKGFVAAVRAFLAFGLCAVCDVLFRARSTPFFQVLMFRCPAGVSLPVSLPAR